jgi:hypothetical protein
MSFPRTLIALLGSSEALRGLLQASARQAFTLCHFAVRSLGALVIQGTFRSFE